MFPKQIIVFAGCTGQVKCTEWDNNARSCITGTFDNSGCTAGNASQNSCEVTHDYSDQCGNVACYITDTCVWDGGGGSPTATPGGPSPTSGGGGNGYWRVSGETRNSTNGLLGGVTATIEWPNGTTQTYDSGASGGGLGVYTVTKNENNVPSSGNFKISAFKSGSWQFYATNSNPGNGCSRTDGNTKYQCPMGMGFNQPDPPPKILHFQAIAPSPTPSACALPGITSHSRNCSGTGLTSVTLNWQNTSCSAYRVQYSTSNTFNSNTATVYSTDVSGTSTTIGNLERAKPWSFRVACKTSNSCTPVMTGSAYTYGPIQSENECTATNNPPTGSFTTSFNGDVTDGGSKTFEAQCVDSEGKVTKARIMRSQKPLSGGSWATPSWITGSSERTNANGASPLDSGSVTLSCTGNQASASHRMMVECEDIATLRCSGDPDKSWNDCGNNDFKVVNCLAPPTASPTPVNQVCAGGCAGPTSFSVAGVCEGNGYDATLTWRKSTNVTTYRLIYDNDANVDSDGSGSGYVDVAASASGTNQSYTFDFADDVDRWFIVRSYAENGSTCSVDGNNVGCYSSKQSINAPVCIQATATPVPNQCAAITVANPTNNCSGATKGVTVNYTTAGFCTSYEIQRATNSNFTADLSSATDTDGSYAFTGLTKNIAHYFRVRCAAKTNSATCTVPGAWSATRTSAACPGPTATPVPSLRTCGQSCDATLVCNSSLGLTCRNGTCRNSTCSNALQNASCICQDAPTATPVPGSCGNSIPSGAVRYDAEEETQPIPAGTNWTYRASDNGTKCQYTCDTGYTWDGNSCEPDVQTRTCGQSCDGTTTVCDSNAGLTCRNSICRNSSCTNAQQNASCVCAGAPTNTPAPVACATPSGLNCGGSCNASGDMVLSCTFTRDPRVTGFTVNYDDDNAFGNDSQNINTSVSGSTASVTYDATTTFPNVTHWYRIKNRTSDGSCVVGNNQYTNTVSTGPASCATFTCTTVRPANSTIHPDDEPPTGGNLRWAHSTTDNNRQCEYYCNAGYTYNATSGLCQAATFTCGGTRPANTRFYTNDDEPTSSGSSWAYSSSDTPAKCEYFCDTGYQWNTTTRICELPLNACVAPVTATGSITCANDGTLTGSWNSVAGASTYRYQRNTSAATQGAVQDDVSGTSISVPIEDPSVTNYFRVRVQSVTNSAACTSPGAWSAWRTVNANTNCAAPSATPVATCDSPTGFVTTPLCTGVDGNLTATWNKESSAILGYDYQISDGANFNAANIVEADHVDQPVGSTPLPGFTFDYPDPNPPNLRYRVRSVCISGITSGWVSRNSTFNPPACGGPTPTPLAYDIEVNLYQTDASCNTTDFLDAPFTGRMSVVEVGNPGPTFTPMPINNPNFVISGLRNTNNLQPQYSQFNNNETPGWTKAVCQVPAYETVNDGGVSPISFYFTKIKGPWWQSSFGDVYGNVLSSKIPTTATNTNLSMSGGGSEAGAVAWNSTLDLSSGNPSQKGYRVGNQALPFNENYSYFESKVGNITQNVASNDINSIVYNSDGFYRLTGNQTLSTNWNVTGKIVIMIDDPNAQLTVQGINPITIGSGGFVFFIVNGSINFSDEVDRVYGMFMARDDITILYDVSNQDAFEGHGSFISTNGDIVSNRSLSGSNNSTNPATEFIYDPGLVVNTPDQLKSNSTIWQEVAP